MSDKANKDQLSDDDLKNVAGGAKKPGADDAQTGAVDDIQARRLQGLEQRDGRT